MILVEGIKEMMEYKGIGKKVVAKKLNVSVETLEKKFENKDFGAIDIEKLIKILDILNPSSIFFYE